MVNRPSVFVALLTASLASSLALASPPTPTSPFEKSYRRYASIPEAKRATELKLVVKDPSKTAEERYFAYLTGVKSYSTLFSSEIPYLVRQRSFLLRLAALEGMKLLRSQTHLSLDLLFDQAAFVRMRAFEVATQFEGKKLSASLWRVIEDERNYPSGRPLSLAIKAARAARESTSSTEFKKRLSEARLKNPKIPAAFESSALQSSPIES